MEDRLIQAAELICRSGRVMALTGAGISLESGIPTFRGAQGLWEKYDPEEYATIQAFRRNPAKVWGMLIKLDQTLREARPNPAHFALARLEEMGRLSALVTQNIDGLHQLAGSKRVVEFHGTGRRLRCLKCDRVYPREEVCLDSLPPCCACGGLLKPDVILFGEGIPEEATKAALAQAAVCRVILVVGTSASVAPACHLPLLVKQAGGKVVEINPEPSPLTDFITDYFFQAEASHILPDLVEQVQRRLEV